MKPKKVAAVSVRFDSDLKERLTTVCNSLRITEVEFIRLAVQQLVDQVDDTGKLEIKSRKR